MASSSDKLRLREELKNAYKSERWAKKVTAMQDDQVFAIHSRLKQQGKL